MIKSKIKFIYIFFICYFFLGLLIYKDYGIGIEEHFQRQNGIYWLKKILTHFKLDDLNIIALEKYDAIRFYDPSLPNINFFNFYGIAFDVPAAFIEVYLKINDSKLYFELRHLFNFIFFFISSFFFYLILKKRFRHKVVIFIGTIFYIINPRIFGDSFHNNIDIFFLSVLTISIFFLFKYFEKQKLKNIILLCFFAAIATSSRIMGLYLPILLFIFMFTDYLAKKLLIKDFFQQTLLISFFYITFLYLHYPYMWKLNIFEFFSWFKAFFYHMNFRILFLGDYYHIKYLPRIYLPIWISISLPIYIFILFLIGYLLMFRRLLKRIINISQELPIHSDLWRSIDEKKDLFIILSLTLFLIFATLLNTAMASGWRHFYFLHIFIIYVSIYSLNLILLFCKKKKININVFKAVNIILVFFIIKDIFIFHPYQSLYFNSLINSKNHYNFPKDTPSLTRSDALKFIIKDGEDLIKINVANASWTPLYNGQDLLNIYEKKKLIFVGQDYDKADYIYTNFDYEVDPRYNNKYYIPKEFNEIKKISIREIPIYSIYKKKK